MTIKKVETLLTGKSKLWLLAIGLLALALPLRAAAALGGDVRTVQDDQVHMQGALRITNAQGFTVHEIRAPQGTVVREYVSPAGKVFGVAWEGPFLPDLRQVLGENFDRFTQAVEATRANRHGHGPLLIELPGLVVESTGHMRSFQGKGYIPETLPEGVHADAIR
jgi:Protein of unknown function (DUF2844)